MAKDQVHDSISRNIYNDIFEPTLSKSDQRRKEIIEGAIEAYAAIDYHHLSYDDIAGPAETSRRLVQHYFPDKKELFEVAMKLLRAQYQALVIEAFSHVGDPREKFATYVRSAVSWPQHQPVHARAWFLYFLVCSQQSKMRKLHEDLAKIGEERIAALIGKFSKAPPSKLKFAAKTVQRLITGAIIELCSESTHPEYDRVENETARACLAVIDSLA